MIPNGTKWCRLALAVALGLSWVAFSISCRNKAAESLKALRTRADQGDAKAQLNLGIMYDHGQGVARDHAEAARWFRKAADQGDAQAQNNLGLMYGLGVLYDLDVKDATFQWVTEDHAEAARWFRNAADQGLAAAQANLAFMYANEAWMQDYAGAARWFRKAADQGDAGAQFNLGLMYAHGQGLTQDYAEAYMWLSLAASRASGDDQEKYADARESVAKKMLPQQIVEAQRLTREWKPKASR
jgi:TPR repeat protein